MSDYSIRVDGLNSEGEFCYETKSAEVAFALLEAALQQDTTFAVIVEKEKNGRGIGSWRFSR